MKKIRYGLLTAGLLALTLALTGCQFEDAAAREGVAVLNRNQADLVELQNGQRAELRRLTEGQQELQDRVERLSREVPAAGPPDSVKRDWEMVQLIAAAADCFASRYPQARQLYQGVPEDRIADEVADDMWQRYAQAGDAASAIVEEFRLTAAVCREPGS